MSLHSRIGRLERDPELLRHGRTVIVTASEHPSEPPGGIVPFNETTWHLYVPEATGRDPIAGLSPEQRGFVRPTDRVIGLAYATADGGELVIGTPDP